MNKSLSQWLHSFSTHHTDTPSLNPTEKFSQIKIAADRLNIHPFSSPLITVVGTNGKGSCVSSLSAIYHAAAYRVGAMTSPHLIHFNERIRINEKPATDDQICQAFEKIETVSQDLNLNYFQYSTLAACIIFQQSNLDIVILEAGLGGRYDPVNLFSADIVIISSIALDHCHILGNTRAKIAAEKIAVARSRKTVICGDLRPPAVISKTAKWLDCNYYQLSKNFNYIKKRLSWSWWYHNQKVYDNLPLPDVLLRNASCALMAVKVLQNHLPVLNQTIQKGLDKICLPARCQLIGQAPLHLYDVAHNVAAVKLLAKYIQHLSFSGRCRALFGVMRSKDVLGIMRVMLPLVDNWYFCDLNNTSLVESKTLYSLLPKNKQLSAHCFHVSAEAYQCLKRDADINDLVLVFGSFYLTGSVLALNKRNRHPV